MGLGSEDSEGADPCVAGEASVGADLAHTREGSAETLEVSEDRP